MSCQICNHDRRLQIDRQICQGNSVAKIAREFGVSSDSVRHHAQNHLSRQLVQAYEKKELAEGLDLLGRIDRILDRAEKIFSRNYKKDTYAGDDVALKALTQQRSTIELMAKISAYLHEARVMELAHGREERERETRAEFAEALDKLDPDEILMLLYLQYKMGYDDGTIPEDCKTPPDAWQPGAGKEPAPRPRPAPKYPRAPAPEKSNLSQSKAHTGGEDEISTPNIPEKEIGADTEEAPAKSLPDAPAKRIPGRTKGLNLVHRHALVKAATGKKR